MLEKLRKQLFQLQDLKYQKFHSNLCPGVSNIIGVRTPDIRKIVKKLLKEDFITCRGLCPQPKYLKTLKKILRVFIQITFQTFAKRL